MRFLTYDNNNIGVTRDLIDGEIEPYAILSHTWGGDEEEVTFREIGTTTARQKKGYRKIEFCGKQARRDRWQHFWVDTCCIDKESSAQLSTAITSMYRWYQQAQVCYVYLADVSFQPRKPKQSLDRTWESSFRKSRWFTRGWTLQELLAPRELVFYSEEWERLGTKDELKELLHDITGISLLALEGRPLSQFTIIERIRWTQGRQTKVKEDEAYCLLGIFSISMSLRYGEGDNAFRRLQKKLDAQSRGEIGETAPYHHDSTSAVTVAQIDEVIFESYSNRRLDVERLSGERLPLERCFINLGIIHHTRDVDTRAVTNPSDPDERGRQLSQFSLESRLKVQIPPPSDQVTLDTLFKSRKRKDGSQSRPNRILIWGRAGMGKTTLCKKIVHDVHKRGLWNDLYDRVIWLPLRKLKRSESRDVVELLVSTFPCTGLGVGTSAVFRKLVHDERTLFLLDGLDEVSMVLESDGSQECLLRELLSQANLIITSRPHSTHELAVHDLDLELETVGFSQSQIDEYLSQRANEYPSNDMENEIQSFMQQYPLVRSLAAIPIQLDAICYAWNAKHFARDHVTMTTLYLAISKSLWKNSLLRLENKTDGRSAKIQRLDRLTWREVQKLVRNETEFLQELAFRGLNEEIIEFSPEDIENLQIAQQLHGDEIVHLTFLRTSDNSVDVEDQSFHFIHLTFQEFFAAQYFVSHWISGKALLSKRQATVGKVSDTLTELTMPGDFIRPRKYLDRYNIFWRFVVGLLQTEQDRKHLHRFLNAIEGSPVDLIGLSHQRLVVHCLGELRQNDSEIQPRVRLFEDRCIQWSLAEQRLMLYWEVDVEYRTNTLLHVSECSDYILEKVLSDTATEVTVLNAVRDRTNISQRVFDVAMENLREGSSEGVQEAIIKLVGRHCSHGRIKVLQSFGLFQIVRAWKGISRLLEPAIMTLTQLLRDPNNDVRGSATFALGNQLTLSDTVVEALIQLLRDPVEDVQWRAAVALEKQSTLPKTTVEALTQLLRDPVKDVRWSAAVALGNQLTLPKTTVEALTQLLRDLDKDIRWRAAVALGKQSILPKTTVEALTQLLRDLDKDVRWRVAVALVNQLNLSDTVVEALIQLLRDPDEDVRWNVTVALGNQSTLLDTVVEALTQLLRDPDKDVRWRAAVALRNQSTLSDTVVEVLTQLLRDPDKDVQGSAAFALGNQLNLSDTVVVALTQLLRDPVKDVRWRAAVALEKQSTLPKTTVEALTQLLRDLDKDIRWRAAVALGEQSILPKTTVEALIQLVQTSDYSTAEDAIRLICTRQELRSCIVDSNFSALTHFIRYLFTYSQTCFVWEGNLYMSASGFVQRIPLSQHQSKQVEDRWKIARKDLGLPDLMPILDPNC